jgi:S1-C subfamily serine protease
VEREVHMRGSPSKVAVLVFVLLAVIGFASATAIGDEEKIISVYEQCGPSVVNITSLAYVYTWFSGTVPEQGTGSGFVYDAVGHIVTNYHVVEGADELTVTLSTGTEYDATVVGVDASNDLAVLKIEAGSELPGPLALVDSDTLRVGQTVLAIGSPYELQQTLTTGVVSALGRVIESPEANQFIGEVIQTDAAINPGNSGGPLLNLDGEVIGVTSQILSTSGSYAGIGFAISSNTVARVVPELIAHGRYRHPWLGIESLTLNSRTAEIIRDAGMDVPVESGVLVIGFSSGSPAAGSGLQGGGTPVRIGRYMIALGGDIIIGVDGVPVETLEDLTIYMELEKSPGDTVALRVLRARGEVVVPVVLGERPVNS